MVLDLMVQHKRTDMLKRSAEVDRYKSLLKPSSKSLMSALKAPGQSFICEIKPASPSQGILRKQVNISEVASIYAPFADAISVLADEKFFQGSLQNVKRVSDEQQCPVLCKDVVVDAAQIYEARHHGADAVLLMLSVLDDQAYEQCAKAALSLNMDVICEVHDESEMKRAVKLKAPIIGINNRNLKTLVIDMDTTERLLPLAPPHALIISESGFSSHRQVMRYSAKVNGFLIGSSLMRSPRIDLALRELIFGRVKICGITNALDARLAYDAGAYYGGVNFSPTSKRMVGLNDARAIIKGAPLKWGGIFVDQPVDELIKIAQELNLDFVQLHGHEAQDYIRDLRPLLPADCEIWKAFGVAGNFAVPADFGADLVLFDSPGGGTGQTFCWELAPKDHVPRFGIAGGINALNIKKAASLNPWLIDIASGAEDGDARKKSKARLDDIFAAVRG